MIPRRVLAGLLLLSLGACASVSPSGAARLATDGEAAATRMLDDLTPAERRVEAARDLLLVRAALAMPQPALDGALATRPDVIDQDRRYALAADVLKEGRKALEALRAAYRAFGHVAAGRDPAALDAALDRANENAEALRTVIERYAQDGSTIIEGLPAGGAIIGVASFAGGVVSRARTAHRLAAPNDALIELLDRLIAALDREAGTLAPLLRAVAADRGEDVSAALRRAGIIQLPETAALGLMAGDLGWTVTPLADARLRDQAAGRLAAGLRAVGDRRLRAESSRLVDPATARQVLVALRERHVALRDDVTPDPLALGEGLRRLAR